MEPHPDSGGAIALFRFPMPKVRTAGDLALLVFTHAGRLVGPTAFGCGRFTNPDMWYATLRLLR
jgi:hypothetical protein